MTDQTYARFAADEVFWADYLDKIQERGNEWMLK